MTARTKRGYHGHATHGADPGSKHHHLMKQHTTGMRGAGVPHAKEMHMRTPSPSEDPQSPPMDQPPPMDAPGEGPMGAGGPASPPMPPGEGPGGSEEEEEGDQT